MVVYTCMFGRPDLIRRMPDVARGKTHISRRLGRYLEFFHAMPVGVYSMSDYRREKYGAISDAAWFDPSNLAANEIRDSCVHEIMNNMTAFLQEHASGVAIFDAANPTHERRSEITQKVLIGMLC
jgi:hypothetical protein